MTEPGDTPETVALRYVREELSTLRASMHDELAAMRTDIANLAQELRSHTADQGPRIAVLEHRIGEVEQRVEQVSKDRTADRRLRVTVVVSLVVAVLGWVPSAIVLFGG